MSLKVIPFDTMLDKLNCPNAKVIQEFASFIPAHELGHHVKSIEIKEPESE